MRFDNRFSTVLVTIFSFLFFTFGALGAWASGVGVDFSADVYHGTAPLEVHFSDDSTGPGLFAWSWTFGDGGTSTTADPVHVYQSPGVYAVSLTVTGINGEGALTRPAYVLVNDDQQPFGDDFDSGTFEQWDDREGLVGADGFGRVVIDYTDGLSTKPDRDILCEMLAEPSSGYYEFTADLSELVLEDGSEFSVFGLFHGPFGQGMPIASVQLKLEDGLGGGQLLARIEALAATGMVHSEWDVVTADLEQLYFKVERSSDVLNLWLSGPDGTGESIHTLSQLSYGVGGSTVDYLVFGRFASNPVFDGTAGALYLDDFGSWSLCDFLQAANRCPLFRDSFETADVAAWTSFETTGNGALTVTSAAAVVGGYGLEATVSEDSDDVAYVRDATPKSERSYRARFFFDPAAVTLAEGDLLRIFDARAENPKRVAAIIQLRLHDGKIEVKASARLNDDSWDDDGVWHSVSASQPTWLEIDWWAAGGLPLISGGGLIFAVAEQVVSERFGLANGQHDVDAALLGVVNGLDPGTYGSFRFDHFESFRN